MYPGWAPPLWSEFECLEDRAIQIEPKKFRIEPEEQLAMVLPLGSWGLIKKEEHKKMPLKIPHMWPQEYGFFSLGRKWLWECEALIPVLTAEYLRENLKD
jgi:5'-3' exonuclease